MNVWRLTSVLNIWQMQFINGKHMIHYFKTCYFCTFLTWCVITSWSLFCVGVCKCVSMVGIRCIISCWQLVQRRQRQVWNRAQDWRPEGWDCWSRMEPLPAADTWSWTHTYTFINTRLKDRIKCTIWISVSPSYLLKHRLNRPDVVPFYLHSSSDRSDTNTVYCFSWSVVSRQGPTIVSVSYMDW